MSMSPSENDLACAACERRRGTESTPDGRLICRTCARERPELLTDLDERSWVEAWGDFVAWMEREETADA